MDVGGVPDSLLCVHSHHAEPVTIPVCTGGCITRSSCRPTLDCQMWIPLSPQVKTTVIVWRIPWLSFSISTRIFIYSLGPLVRGPPRTGGSNLYETRKAMWSYHYLDKIFNHIRTWRSWVSSSHHMIIDVKGWLHCFEGFNRPAVVAVINCLW